MKITIISEPNTWFEKYNIVLSDALSELGHAVNIISEIEQIESGDILFALSLYKLIKKEYLSKNRHNIVIHESDLPAGKGWSPLSWQVLEGKNNIIFSLFEIDEKMDNGNIYFKDELILIGVELNDELRELQAKKRIEMCLKFVNSFPWKSFPQIGAESFYKKRGKDSSLLDVNKSIADQFDLLRIVDNEHYPAFFNFRGKKFKLKIENYDEDPI
ncbi:MAG: methionyl-tRNA formyltransferase [Rickettsiales bacterium]|jgi:methionyl-tRNA formyltransferase